jgi:hypothetical protein
MLALPAKNIVGILISAIGEILAAGLSLWGGRTLVRTGHEWGWLQKSLI